MAAPRDRLRLIVVGDSGVGKTSVILRYTKGLTAGMMAPTVGVDCRSAVCELAKIQYRLEIWDTAGQERYRSFAASYFRQADGVMLFYSVTSRQSFENLSYWKQLVDSSKSADNVPVIILGNKSDMVEVRDIDPGEGESRAQSLGCEFLETSALTGEGVEQAFEAITKTIITMRQQATHVHITGIAGSVADLPARSAGHKRKKRCCK
jgi:small GTP-binding protein